MKVRCPKCGVEGFLQKRNNSCRVQHYQGFANGKRLYAYHRILGSAMEYLKQVEVSGSKSLEVKDFKSNSVNQTVRAGSLARLGHLLDVQKVAGSSPVRPTN